MRLSPIQNKIISRLKNADSLRYRDMMSSDVAGDLFNYHLKMLLKKKLVDKIDTGYCLSQTGREYVADVYHSSDQANRLFKLNVITIVSRPHHKSYEVLTQTRHSQPSYGQVGIMGGTIIKGESFVDGARRKLEQETGLRAYFRLLGIERRQLHKEDELFSDVLFPICYASAYDGTLLAQTEFGNNYWVPIEAAITNDTRPYDSIQAIPRVLSALRDNKLDAFPFFCDETIQRT